MRVTDINGNLLSTFDIPGMCENDFIQATTAYHDQFTVTASEREKQIAIAFSNFIQFLPVDLKDYPAWDEFLKSFDYKSIPPAMPSREEAEKKSKDPHYQWVHSQLHKRGFMDCFDWITK